ncbi:MAG: hypothetical protein HQ568_06025 [Calditrichaeota bacterium]|nr:hypothetical protein [Calditrichota bacterium]
MFAAKRTAVVSGVVAVIFIAMLLIPASYSVNVGSLVKAEFNMDEANLPLIMSAVDGIDKISNQNLSVNNGKAELNIAFRDRSAGSVEAEVQNALSGVLSDNAELSVSSENITKLMGGNALAAVSGGAIRIGCDDMSDAEIEALIINALSSSGLQIQDIDVSTTENSDGQIRRIIRVEGDVPEGVDPCDIDLSRLTESLENDAGDKKMIIIRKNCEDGAK